MPPSLMRQSADEGLDQRFLNQILTVELLECTLRQAAAYPREPTFGMALELRDDDGRLGDFVEPSTGEERCGL